jgi:hypothetical protein
MFGRTGRKVVLTALVGGALLVVPSVASAAVLCVGTSGGACTQSASTLAAALTAAHSGDTIQLGAGTYDSPGTAIGTAVTLKGVGEGGANGTTVTTTGSPASVLNLNGAVSAVSDLEVLIPSGVSEVGLSVDGPVTNVSVVGASGSTENYGVALEGTGSTFSGTVDMRAASPPLADVVMEYGSVTNSLIEGGVSGIDAEGPGPETVTATRILGISATGVDVSGGGDLVLKDSLVTLASPCNEACATLNVTDDNSDPSEVDTLVATQDTLVAGTTSGGQPAGDPVYLASQASETVQATLDSTVAAGFPVGGSANGFGFYCAFPAGTSDLSVIYSSIDLDDTTSGADSTADCDSFTQSNNENQGGGSPVLPIFVNAAAGDYHLPYNSPLVDAGDPTLSGGTDLDGNPRVVNGKGTSGPARTDIGAYEYQRAAPIAKISAPTTGTTTTPITFNGSGSSEPNDGEAITYAWKFDTGATASGPTASYTFTSPGTHTATLTVTAPTGLTASATATVVVALPAPVISALKLSVDPFRDGSKAAAIFTATKVPHLKRGTLIELTLSEAASVTLSFDQAETGREKGGNCLAATHARRRLKRCTRYVPVNGLLSFALAAGNDRISFYGVLAKHEKLKPGTYELTVNAQASSGPPATAVETAFKVRR